MNVTNRLRRNKYITMVFVVILIVGGGLIYLDINWRNKIISDVKCARALPTGESVNEVLTELLNRYSNSAITWEVSNYDDLYLSAKVYCRIVILMPSGITSKLFFAWQWDYLWPEPKAITPITANTFSNLDPKCQLTTDGYTTLSQGKDGFKKYFSYKRELGVAQGN